MHLALTMQAGNRWLIVIVRVDFMLAVTIPHIVIIPVIFL